MSGVLSVFNKLVKFSSKYPITRGMASYAVIWPVGSLIQQSFINNKKELDFKKAARFALYGSCFVAPTLYLWLRLAGAMYPLITVRSALAKATIEQFTYTPFAMVCFYYGMTLLEGGTKEAAAKEVQEKFLPTYKVGMVVWPALQTLNYTVIAEKNRVVFVSICSLLWTTFLAYMKHLDGVNHQQSEIHPVLETHPITLSPSLTTINLSENVWPFQKSLEH